MTHDYDDARPPSAGRLEAENADLRARVAELEAALDSHHAEVGHNIWRFWLDKAQEAVGKLAIARDDALKGRMTGPVRELYTRDYVEAVARRALDEARDAMFENTDRLSGSEWWAVSSAMTRVEAIASNPEAMKRIVKGGDL